MDRSRVRQPHSPLVLPVNFCGRAQSLRELHARGILREEIEHTLKIMPFVRQFTDLAHTQLQPTASILPWSVESKI